MKDRATVESRLPKAGGVSDLHGVWRSELTADEQLAITRCVGVVPSSATTGGPARRQRPGAAPPGRRRARAPARPGGTAPTSTARWPSASMLRAASPSSSSPNRSSRTCVCLEPDADPRYAVLDATKYSSQRILDAEHEIVTTARTRADWSIAPRPDERLGDDQALAVEALTAIPHQLTTIVGPAGAGKTTDAPVRRGVVPRRWSRRVRADALGGGRPGRHRGDRHPGDDHRQLATRDRRPPPPGLVLVDEASMVPTLTLHQLTPGREGPGMSRRTRRRLRPDGITRSGRPAARSRRAARRPAG